jgi:mRNA-degrading endonuclease YafQ of YafQ-DinJ toxin-antitoxin module
MEVIMKPLRSILALSISLLVLASCSSSLQQRQVVDDLYYTPDKDQNVQIAKEFEKDYEKAIADNDKSVQQLDTVADLKKSTNPYEEILVDDPVEAQKRRNKAMRDPSYGITNYYDFRFSDAYRLASSFDPMFYNTVIMGNSVWVEPAWMSSRYGYNYGFYNAPYNSFRFGFNTYPYSSMYSFHPYHYGYGYSYGSGYNYNNFAYFGYTHYNGYPYSPYGNYSGANYYSGYYNMGESLYFNPYPYKKRKNRTSIQHDPTQTEPSIARYYKNSNKDKRAKLSTKGRGDKIRTIHRAYDEEAVRYIRTADRKRRINDSERYRDNNTVRKYINDASGDNSRSRNTRRYYDRPDNESNYNELRRKQRDSHYRKNNSSSNRNYNRNNDSSFNNNNSNNNRSINRSSGSSSGNNSSSSSGRKKR